jgi:hypothetical protein
MALYPDWPHRAVALAATNFGISAIQALSLISSLLIILGSILAAIRIVRSTNGYASVLTVVSIGVALYSLTSIGLSLSGHIRYNYFYPQLFSTVAALAFFYVLDSYEQQTISALVLIVVVGGIILPNLHLIGALWFSTAALIRTLTVTPSGVTWRRAGRIAAGAAILLAVWKLSPAVSSMIEISGNNGEFDIASGAESASIIYTLFGVGALLLASAVVVELRKGGLLWGVVYRHSGLIAILGLGLSQVVVWSFRQAGSPYAVLKYAYILAFEICSTVAYLAAETDAPTARQLKPMALLGLTAFFFLLQDPFLNYTIDQGPLIRFYAGLNSKWQELRSVQPRRYPQFPFFSIPQNYYLAISALRYPRDAITENWALNTSNSGVEALSWDSAAFPPAWYAGSIRLGSGLDSRVSTPGRVEIEVELAQGERFEVANRIPAKPGEIVVGFRMYGAAGEQLHEGRALLVAKSGSARRRYTSTLELAEFRSRAHRVEVGVVHEFISWFPIPLLSVDPTQGARPAP